MVPLERAKEIWQLRIEWEFFSLLFKNGGGGIVIGPHCNFRPWDPEFRLAFSELFILLLKKNCFNFGYLSIHCPTFSTFLNYIHFSSIVCAKRDWWKSEEYGKIFGRGREGASQTFRFLFTINTKNKNKVNGVAQVEYWVYDEHNKFNYLKLFLK